MRSLLFLSLILYSGILFAQTDLTSSLKGPYLGQNPPGLEPELFAPDIICTDSVEAGICFSFDGNIMVFRRHFREATVIYISEKINDSWTKPIVAPFYLKPFGFGDFTFSLNELKVYFTSRRPHGDDNTATESADLWMVEKEEGVWQDPVPFGDEINSSLHDSYPSVASDKSLYFFRRFDENNGTSEIMYSEFINDKYIEPVKLGSQVNTEWHEWDPCISADGNMLLFCSTKPDGYGEDDIFISFKNENGDWSQSINLGDKINTPQSENRPFLTADGQYLFFNSNRRGNRDIFWVDAEILEQFKPIK